MSKETSIPVDNLVNSAFHDPYSPPAPSHPVAVAAPSRPSPPTLHSRARLFLSTRPGMVYIRGGRRGGSFERERWTAAVVVVATGKTYMWRNIMGYTEALHCTTLFKIPVSVSLDSLNKVSKQAIASSCLARASTTGVENVSAKKSAPHRRTSTMGPVIMGSVPCNTCGQNPGSRSTRLRASPSWLS